MDSAGFLNETWRDVIALVAAVGVGIAILGVGIAIEQIRRTRSSAEAARNAAIAAKKSLSGNLFLTDITSAIRLVSEIRNLHLAGQYDVTVMLLSTLTAIIVQVSATRPGRAEDVLAYKKAVEQLGSLEVALVQQQKGSGKQVDPTRVHRRLIDVSNLLTNTAAAARSETGGTNADS